MKILLNYILISNIVEILLQCYNLAITDNSTKDRVKVLMSILTDRVPTIVFTILVKGGLLQ